MKFLPFFILACTGQKDSDSAPLEDTQSNDTGTDSFPQNPSPFTIEVSGAETLSLIFDSPTCGSPQGSSNMRVFWRNRSEAHVFVLYAEVLNTFEGVGTYEPPTHRANIKLQEEAGGQARYYASSDQSAVVSIDFEIYEEDRIYGSAEISSMFGSNGEITISPNTFPLWCDSIER